MIAEERERYRSKAMRLKNQKSMLKMQLTKGRILSLMEETEFVRAGELREMLVSLRKANYFF